jgi:hypothetical protein
MFDADRETAASVAQAKADARRLRLDAGVCVECGLPRCREHADATDGAYVPPTEQEYADLTGFNQVYDLAERFGLDKMTRWLQTAARIQQGRF